jgi:HK97 family phage major capsid protein
MTLDELVAELKALVDKAESENRPLSDAEVQRAEELEANIQRAQKTNDIKTRSQELTKVRSNAPAVNTAAAKDNDVLERAFDAYLRTGQANADLVELRAQSVGTNSAGGYTVPETLRQKLVDRRKSFGGVAANAQNITTTSGEPMTYPTLDDTGNLGVIAAENTAPASGGADLVFGEKTLGAFKYIAPGASNLPLRVSVELLQDSAFDVEALVKDKLATRIYRKQAVDFVNGSGTGEPEGLTTATAVTSTFTAAAPTYAELVAAKHVVDPEYRDSGNCKWYFNDATFALIEQVVDGNGRPLLFQSTDSITGAAVYSLLGYPVVIDQAFATYTDGGTNKWGVFGDLQEGYVVRTVKDVQVIVNPYSRANEGQVEFTLWARADGRIQNPYAFAVLKNAV